MKSMRFALFMLCVGISAISPSAQVTTGTPAFGTFSSGPDVINIGNLNTHLDIPIINKTGRGLNFAYDLTYDSSVWYPVSSGGSMYWEPVGGWGWGGQIDGEAAPGFNFNASSIITYAAIVGSPVPCGLYSTYTTTTFNSFTYFDSKGTPHAFNASGTYTTYSVGPGGNPTGCPTAGPVPSTFTSANATDGSGLTLYYIPSSPPYAYVVQSNGTKIDPPVVSTSGTVSSSTFQAEDSNGNYISGNDGIYTDTAGNTALTVTSNASAHTVTLGFANTLGTTSSYIIHYSPYNIQTSFGCTSPLVHEYTSSGVYLPSSITLPDTTSTYEFTYEATPGSSGYTTGRIASVTFPSGDTISYTYTGGSNGITCTDGTTSGVTRKLLADSGSAAQTWTYTRTLGTGTSHTNLVDGLGNNLQYDFVAVNTGTAANYFETHRKIFNGSGGTAVLERYTCFNGSSSPCTTTSITPSVGQVDTYETLDGVETHGSTTSFNTTYGTVTEAKTYDFALSASSRGALMRDEKWTYSTTIPSLPLTDKVYDQTGTTLAGETTFAYDQTTPTSSSGVPNHTTPSSAPGNLTTETVYASTSQSYALTATYEDTGTLLTSVTPNGTTTLTYDPTFVYNQVTTLPTPSSGVVISGKASFDIGYSGLPLTTTDPSGQITHYTTYDSSLRPKVINYPDGGETDLSITPTQVSQAALQASGVSSDTETQLDGYGRTSSIAIKNAASSYYMSDTCYDANGNASFQSYPYSYSGSLWPTSKVCSGSGDTTAYDVLGRVVSVTKANGELYTYKYSGRAIKAVDTNSVVRISQIDGLGRPVTVCEISSNSLPGGGSPVSCGTDIAGTGYVTSYAYALATGTTTVTQGAQTRTFTADWLGRPTSVTEPESGTTNYTYTYNSNGLSISRSRPEENQTSPSNLRWTTTQYDSLGRVTGISYTGTTPAKSYRYDVNSDWGLSQTNIIGRLTWSNVNITPDGAKTIYSYDAMGRVIMAAQCRPSTCGTTQNLMNYTYDLAGNMLTSTDGAGVTSTYTVSLANELKSLTSSKSDTTDPANLIASVQNGPFGPTGYSVGNGLTAVGAYDTLGRIAGGWVCNGSSSQDCTGGTQLYGFTSEFRGSRMVAGCDTVLNQCISYPYDEFNRLTGRNVYVGTAQNYTYSYDRYGNRWTQTPTSGSGYTSSLNFSATTNQVSSGVSYDAAGNMTNDGNYTYVYDAEGRIVTVNTEGGATVATYLYDALGHRVQTVVGTTDTEFVYNPAGQRVSIWNGTTGAQIQGQYYWGAKPVAFYKGGSTHFQHQDWLGTERLRSTYNGGVDGAFTSLPFGDGLTTAAGADNDANHYAMLDHDYESDTEHAQFRQYSSAQGHWLSPDPYSGSYDFSNPQSLNRYVYAANSPLSAIDPSGLYLTGQGGYQNCGNDPICTPSSQSNGGLFGSPSPGYGQGLLGGNGILGGSPNSILDSLDVPVDGWYVSPVSGKIYLAINGVFYGPNGEELGPSSLQEEDLSVFYASPGMGAAFQLAQNNAPNNVTPLTPEQLHKQQQTKLNTRCAAASASSAALATNAGLNEVGAALTGEVSPFAAIFHGIALVEGIGAGGVGIYAAFACYNAAQF